MRVNVDVIQSEALRRGSAKWGPQPIDLEAVLALLTEEERGRIEVVRESLRIQGELSLQAPTTDAADVATAIREGLAARDAKVAKERAEIEALQATAREHAQAALEAGVPLYDSDRGDVYPHPEGYYYSTRTEYRAAYDGVPGIREARETERAAAEGKREEALRAWVEGLISALDEDRSPPPPPPGWGPWDDKRAASRFGLDAALGDARRRSKERSEAAKRRVEETLRAWALEHGSDDLRAAIRDGYPHTRALRQELRDWLVGDGPAASPTLTGKEATRATDGECSVPRAPSRQLHAALTDWAATAQARAPEGVKVEVSRIQRCSWYEPCGARDEYGDDCDLPHDEDGDHTLKGVGVLVTITIPGEDPPHHRLILAD